MKRTQLAFISGAVTGIPGYNKEAFDKAERLLRSRGYDVFNPMSMLHILKHKTHEECMKILIPFLCASDYIYQLEGWEQSQGATDEDYIAKITGINRLSEIDMGA